MAVPSSVSLILSSVFSVLLFCGMQIYKPLLASTQISTILGGFIGSWLFILSLTAVSNLEVVLLGRGFQAKLFPETIFCLVGAMLACGMVHRVCASTCMIFSIIALYYVNKISQKTNSLAPSMQQDIYSAKKKKK